MRKLLMALALVATATARIQTGILPSQSYRYLASVRAFFDDCQQFAYNTPDCREDD